MAKYIQTDSSDQVFPTDGADTEAHMLGEPEVHLAGEPEVHIENDTEAHRAKMIEEADTEAHLIRRW